MAQNELGKAIGAPILIADGVPINVRDYGGVIFFGTKSGGDTYTLTSATTATAGSNLAKITQYWEATAVDGSVKWTKHADQAAAATVVTTSFGAAFYVDERDLPDGQSYITVTSTSTGLVLAIPVDPKLQRSFELLAASGV